jgi:hypothetical protein
LSHLPASNLNFGGLGEEKKAWKLCQVLYKRLTECSSKREYLRLCLAPAPDLS